MTKRAEATKGFHDDAIMAMCLALYAREAKHRGSPVGIGGDIAEEYSEAFKAEIYDEIKREFAKDSPEDWLDEDELEMIGNVNRDDSSISVSVNYRRQHDALLREFGW